MRCCNLHNRIPRSEPITKLIAICQNEQEISFDKCQIPINIDENLIMKLQFDESCITYQPSNIHKTNKVYNTFIKTFNKFNIDELQDLLSVSVNQIKEYILRCVPCIGCRTSIDNFLKSSMEYGHQALEPFLINEKGLLAIKPCHLSYPDYIYSLFYIHGSKLNSFIESISKSKKNRRCNMHSIDKTKFTTDWETVWDLMDNECRNQVTLVKAHSLLDTLENYLYKHKFCAECKLKVLEAYHFLFNNRDNMYRTRKGFSPGIYEGLRSCNNDEHIHVRADKDFVSKLICRAESEFQDSDRERHARTLEIAQEEILICIGINLCEKFDKIYRMMKTEEQTWQLLLFIVIDYLRLNFERSIISQQDLCRTINTLCEEVHETNEIKSHKKQKRNNKKNRRQIKTIEQTMAITDQISETFSNQNKQQNSINHSRTSSSCACLCLPCNGRSNSSSTTSRASLLLSKSQSCPSISLLSIECLSQSTKNEHRITRSNSIETLFTSVSIHDSIFQEMNLEDKQPISIGNELLTSSSVSCTRCSSARTDLGYSSDQGDVCSSTTCDACLTDRKIVLHSYPSDKVYENCDKSTLSNGINSNDNHSNETVKVDESILNYCLDCTKTIELCDMTRKHKLKLQLCNQYPFFNMDLKQAWDETDPTSVENCSFISDDDCHEFLLCNSQIERKRAQLRENFKLEFQIWQQQTLLNFSFKNSCK